MNTPQGFVAGTVEHALDKEGKPALIPIEQLQVGDMVLTRYTPDGELVYKPITATHSTPNKQIFSVQMKSTQLYGYSIDELITMGYTDSKSRLAFYNQHENILCTQYYPFWVNETQSCTPLDDICLIKNIIVRVLIYRHLRQYLSRI